jgi:phage terminase large subunit-like protein
VATHKVPAASVKTFGYVEKANQYIDDVLSGKTAACEYVRLACKRQREDLEKAKQPLKFPFRFDVWAAERICIFAEGLSHYEGALAGQTLTLEPWQCFFLTTVFGWVHAFTDKPRGIKEGKRRFRKAYAEIPRGNGKSFLSSVVELYMAFVEGEGGAQCYVLATTKDQGDAVYNTAKAMVDASPEFRKEFGVQVDYYRITQPSTKSFIKCLPNKRDGKLDSLNVHLAVVDELHAHDVPDAYMSLESGMGKRDQSLLWSITTAGSNQAGICYEKNKYVKELLEGKTTNETFFGIIYTLDTGDDWKDRSSWIKANPNWNVSVSPTLMESNFIEALKSPSAQGEFKRKFCNLWDGAASAWMDMERWNACRDTTLKIEDFLEDECIPGLDAASRLDLAALVKVFRRFNEDDEKFHYFVFCDFWLPEFSPTVREVSAIPGWFTTGAIHKSEGNYTDFDLIEEHLIDFCRAYKVKEIAFDTSMLGMLITHLQKEFGEDFMVPVSQGTKSMTPAMRELMALVTEKRIHFNDEVLTWNMSNVVARFNEYGDIKPDKTHAHEPTKKIDGVDALLNAIYRWTAYIEEETYEPSLSFIDF